MSKEQLTIVGFSAFYHVYNACFLNYTNINNEKGFLLYN